MEDPESIRIKRLREAICLVSQINCMQYSYLVKILKLCMYIF
jgi:hypothetical protein